MEYLNTALLALILLLVIYLALKQRTPRIKNVATTSRAILLDSSALIDGRVTEVAEYGFLSGTLVVPGSVLREMQYLADNSDHEKRARARHGLDVVKQLQQLTNTKVQILDDGLPVEGGVDERLVQLSKQYKADLLTLDFNLNKVAQAEGITVLNINQLAQTLRMNYLPGEKRDITLVQKGQDNSQAVGYLEDGTMVVVENAGKYIGKSVSVEFTRAIQTQAGKMLFAKKIGGQQQQTKPKQKIEKTSLAQTKPVRKPQQRRKTPEDSLVELANKQ